MAKAPTTPAARKPTAAPAMAVVGADGHLHDNELPPLEMDYPAHERMYHNFTQMVKWGIVGAVVLVLFLFIVIHPLIPTVAS